MHEYYIMVGWPEIQDFMNLEDFDKCIFCQEIIGHPCPDDTYMVPKWLYDRVTTSLTSCSNK